MKNNPTVGMVLIAMVMALFVGCHDNDSVLMDVDPVDYVTGKTTCRLVTLDFNFDKQTITFTNGNDVAVKARVLTQDDGVLLDNTNLGGNSDPVERNHNAEPFSIGDQITIELEFTLGDIFWNAIVDFWHNDDGTESNADTICQGFLAEGDFTVQVVVDQVKYVIPLPLTQKVDSSDKYDLVSCTLLGQMSVENPEVQKNNTLHCENNSSDDQRIQLYQLTKNGSNVYVSNGVVVDMMIVPQVGEQIDVKSIPSSLSENTVYGLKIYKERFAWSPDPSYAIFRLNLVDQYADEVSLPDVFFDF